MTITRDERLAEARRWLALHPLVPAALLFVLGLCIGSITHWPLLLDLLAMGIALLLWLAFELPAQRQTVIATVALALAIMTGGCATWRVNQQYVEPDHVALLFPPGARDESAFITARLRIVTDPILVPAPPELPIFAAHDSQHFVGEMLAVQNRDGLIPASGTVTVTSSAKPPLQHGQIIELYGHAARPEPPSNPGEFDYEAYLASSRIFAHVSAMKESQIRIIDTTPYRGLNGWIDSLRLALRAKLLAHVAAVDAGAGGAMVAIFLGYRAPGMEPISQAFSDAGVAHLLAISGMHVVLIAGLAWWALRLLIPRPRWRAGITALVVLAYMIVTPCGPPVLRAGCGTLLVLASWLLGRPARHLNILAATLFILLLARPGDFFDAGFQLTFAATAGLILVGPRVPRLLFGNFLDTQATLARMTGSRTADLRVRILRLVCGLLSANLIGSVMSAPLVAFHFHQFNALAMFTGVLVLPMVAAVIITAVLQLIAGTVSLWLGACLAPVSAWVANATVSLVRALAGLPGASLATRAPPWWLIILAYGVVTLWVLRRGLGLSRATLTVAFAAIFSATAAWYAVTQRHGALHIWSLAVGNGDCIVLETPEGRCALLDAGSLSRPSLAAHVIEPFLRAEGISSLDVALATQTSAEHINALPDIVRRYHPPLIACSANDRAQENITYVSARFFAQLRTAGAHPQGLRAGDRLHLGPEVLCEVLWPPAREAPLPPAQAGLILQLSFGTHRLLISSLKQDIALSLLAGAGKLPRCDAALFTGPGSPSPALQQLLQPAVQHVVTGGLLQPMANNNPASPNEQSAPARAAWHMTIPPIDDLTISSAFDP